MRRRGSFTFATLSITIISRRILSIDATCEIGNLDMRWCWRFTLAAFAIPIIWLRILTIDATCELVDLNMRLRWSFTFAASTSTITIIRRRVRSTTLRRRRIRFLWLE